MNPACRMLWSDFGWRRCEDIAAKDGKKEESGLLALSLTCDLTPDFARIACCGLHRVQFLGCTASSPFITRPTASFGACDEGAGCALGK